MPPNKKNPKIHWCHWSGPKSEKLIRSALQDKESQLRLCPATVSILLLQSAMRKRNRQRILMSNTELLHICYRSLA